MILAENACQKNILIWFRKWFGNALAGIDGKMMFKISLKRCREIEWGGAENVLDKTIAVCF